MEILRDVLPYTHSDWKNKENLKKKKKQKKKECTPSKMGLFILYIKQKEVNYIGL